MLQPLENTELSAYCIQLLAKQDITTIRQFLDTENVKLCKILRIDERKTLNIKQQLMLQFAPKQFKLSELYQKQLSSVLIYKTGIPTLDDLLDEADAPLTSSSIWEICGLVGTGKTMLFYSLALNFVCNYAKAHALFIDTKNDFSASRIREILRARNVPKAECGLAMQAIQVVAVDSAEELLKTLELLKEGLDCGAAEVANIKVVFVDSLPALWLDFRSDDERKESQYLLTKLAIILRRLAKQNNVASILGNLTLTVQKENVQDIADVDAELLYDCDAAESIEERILLGQYWSTVPHLRLSLETVPMESDEHGFCVGGIRKLNVLKNCMGITGANCILQLSAAGFN